MQKSVLRLKATAIGLTLLLLLGLMPTGSDAADLIDLALCDVRVTYLFEDPEAIDWPTLYYLNDQFGCRIDLLSVAASHGFYFQSRAVVGKGIELSQYFANPENVNHLDSLLANQFRLRRPDIVILGATRFSGLTAQLAERLTQQETDETSLFQIRKFYRLATPGESDPARRAVALNRRELVERYRDRMTLEIPQLYSWMRVDRIEDVRLVRYDLIRKNPPDRDPDPDFLAGIEPLRLLTVLDSVLGGGAVERSFLGRARQYIASFEGARRFVGVERVESAITGYKALLELLHQVRSESRLSSLPEFRSYLGRLIRRAQAAVMHEIGMDWDGTIKLHDSPHGPKLKFNASLSVNGPKPIELSYVRFHPYWDSLPLVLDSTSRRIAPHQSFVREYLVEIERGRLEATMPESLLFSAEIVYGVTPMTLQSAVPIWERPDLQVAFHPGFFFVPPVAQIEVDKIVRAMNWKAVISKPLYFHGDATLNLETPRGVFAGAYRQDWNLERGRATETVRIPFSVSKLLELGIQHQTVSLTVDGRVVAADTGMIRIASCQIDDKVTIGLMPDTTGLLEDILRMAAATYQPLTDRTLTTGDLDAYTVLLIGSGAVRNYPSFRLIKGRLEEYVRQGGSLVIFGQPRDWPENALPISLVPSIEHVRGTDLLNRIPAARVTSGPYTISESNLLSWLEMRRKVGAAVVSPAEKVYVTPSGATLLSVSRIGDGQIIFCGLPLVDMISQLNIEAIHLLANILNY